MLNTSFSTWPSFTEEEASAVQQVLLSNKVNYWTGSECREFEKEFAAWTGSQYAIALANGTVALDLALNALHIEADDEVVVTSRTFIASVSCVVNIGATPVFADVDTNSGNITAESIEAVLSSRTKAIICVHLAGWPCDMDPIMALAERHGLKVIEDCAQAHGASYKGRSVGSIGHIAAWSFCQDKIMSTGGEGGMVTTDDHQFWSSMWSYKDHGKSWQAVYEKQHPSGFRWLHNEFGTNYRMTEMQAAIGRIQLKRMPEWHRLRKENSAKIQTVCDQLEVLRCPKPSEQVDAARYKFYTFVRPKLLKSGWDRDRIVDTIVKMGVPCYQGTCSEVYLEEAFEGTIYRPAERLPGAKELGETSLMFLVHPTLTSEEISRTCHALEEVMVKASA